MRSLPPRGGRENDAALVEGPALRADDLVRLVALAGQEHGVPGRGGVQGAVDGPPPVHDLDRLAPRDARGHLGDDLRRVLGARVVRGDDGEVGVAGHGRAHRGTLGRVPVSAGAEDHDQAARHQRPHGAEDLIEGVRGVGEVDHDPAWLTRHELHASPHRGRRAQSGGDLVERMAKRQRTRGRAGARWRR